MIWLYLSRAMLACYDIDTSPDPQSPPTDPPASDPHSIEPPLVETPPEDPPKLTYEQLATRLKELEAIAERESAWTAREAELTASLAERDGRLAEMKARADKALIERAVGEAAVKLDAFSPAVIHAIIGGRATVEGDQVVIDLDGVKLTPAECLEKMREEPAFASLFRSQVAPGIGGHSNSGMGAPGSGGRVNIGTLTSAEYRHLRKTNPRALGLDRDPEVRR